MYNKGSRKEALKEITLIDSWNQMTVEFKWKTILW